MSRISRSRDQSQRAFVRFPRGDPDPVKPLITHGPYASTTGLSYGLAGGGERGMIG